jgi:hypothetical protein
MSDRVDNPGSWIALSEAAAYFRVSERTLRRRIKTGELRSQKKSGHVYVLVYGPLDAQSDKADKAEGVSIAPDLALLQAENERLRAEVAELKRQLMDQVTEDRNRLYNLLLNQQGETMGALANIQKMLEGGEQTSNAPARSGWRRWWPW